MRKSGLKDRQPGISLICRGFEVGYIITLLETEYDEIGIEAATTDFTVINQDSIEANGDYKWGSKKQTEVIEELLDFANTQEEFNSEGKDSDCRDHYNKDPNYRDFNILKKLDECHLNSVCLKNELDGNINPKYQTFCLKLEQNC